MEDILEAHRQMTVERARPHKTLLAIQDKSGFVCTSHDRTKRLGPMSQSASLTPIAGFILGASVSAILSVF
jgi:hypothetical protein